MNSRIIQPLAIVASIVLATSFFVQSAEAAAVVTAKDTTKGLKVKCGVSPQHTLRCDFQSKYGIDKIEATDPNGGTTTTLANCKSPVRTDSNLIGGNVKYSYIVIDCTGAGIIVDVELTNKTITSITIN